MSSTSFDGTNSGTQVGINHGVVNILPGPCNGVLSSADPNSLTTSVGLDRPEPPQQRTDQEVLRSLAFPQMLDRRDNIEPCHTNTCQWILDLDQYKHWRSQSCGLLWIKGKPGAGKSTLMAFLHDQLKMSHEGSQGLRLDFFFTARGTELQRTPLGMFRSLLSQIFDRDTSVRSQVREIYEKRCRQFGYGEMKWEWPRVVLEELLTGAILTSANQQPVTVFVDALDEAGAESAQQLATYFHRLVDRAGKTKSAVQICISCRHYPIVENAQAIEIHVEDHNHKDISTYIEDTLADTEDGDGPSQETRERMLEQLLQQANGVFQWAHLMMPLIKRRMLEGESFDDIRRWVREIPAGLEDVYTYILSEVIEDRNRGESYLLFQWICLAERPLSVTEMRYALTASNARMTTSPQRRLEDINGFIKSNDRMKRRIKALSGGLTEVVLDGHSDETVQVVHQSVNDFLRTKGLRLLHYYVAGNKSSTNDDSILFQCQATLYRSCMACLATKDLPEKVLGARRKARDLNRDFPFLYYATINLFIHAEKAASFRADSMQNELDRLEQITGRWVQFFQILDRHNTACPANGTTLLHMAAATNLVDIIDSLLSNGEKVSMKDDNGSTAFHLAARGGHIPAGTILLEQRADPEARCRNGKTPLVEAAGRGNVRFIEWLLGLGVNLESTRSGSEGALQAAAAEGHQGVVETLIGAGANINAQGGGYGNALQAAANQGSIGIVQILLNAQANVNAQGGGYGNALQAAANQGSIGIVQILLNAQANVNAQGGLYGNALQAAAYQGSTEVVQILLDAQADVNAQGGTFGNALQAAAYQGSTEVVQILLDAQADVNAQGGIFGNALQAAAYGDSTEIVQILLDAQADVNAQGGKFGNALQAAACRGFTEKVQILLDAQADVNAQGGLYGNALQAAAYRGFSEIVQMLLDAGADVLLVNEIGQTPLHIASLRNRLDILRQFPQFASAVNIRDKLSRTPLHLAIYLRHIEFALMLLSLGADPRILDGYGRNIMDWAQGDQNLMHQIRGHCPEISLTPADIQNWSLHQSVSQISGTLLYPRLDFPSALLRQLGRYLLFLGEMGSARYLFQLHLSRVKFDNIDTLDTTCDFCGICIIRSHFVCKTCAHVDLCSSCVQKHSYDARLHPDQQHETFEVPDVSEDDFKHTGLSSEQFRSFLKNLIREFSAPKAHEIETQSSDASVPCPALKEKRLVPSNVIDSRTMVGSFLFAFLVLMLGYWYF